MSYSPLSFQVVTTLAAQRVVAHHGTNADTVVLATSSATPIGISMDTVKDTTSGLPVAVAGKAKLLFNDTVAAGGLVSADDSGRGIPFVNATVSAAYVGILLGAAVAATGTIAEVLIMPGRDSTG